MHEDPASSPPSLGASQVACLPREPQDRFRLATPSYSSVTGEDIAKALGGLVSEVDQAALTGELADMFARSLQQATVDGLDGWIDDDLAFVAPWGFDVQSIEAPVVIWQGRHDRMVPFAHGEVLESAIPSAMSRLLDDEGHISLLTKRLGDILDDVGNPSRG